LETIEQLKRAINSPDDQVKPIFGICLSNQILGLATGGRAKELLFGNRGQNQPVINHAILECYITPQNHGYINTRQISRQACLSASSSHRSHPFHTLLLTFVGI
jgi:carbamoylphosphate synthase small subunit